MGIAKQRNPRHSADRKNRTFDWQQGDTGLRWRSVLLSRIEDDENLELTIGQDFAIGYESHDSKEVRLFATNPLRSGCWIPLS